MSGLLKHRLPFILENQLKEDLKDHDFNSYPDKSRIFESVKNAFATTNKEVCTMLPDVRFR